MNINIKLNKNFTTAFNRMLADYGEELAKLNGFSDAQLSYTDFIDNFVDKQTVADASIDGNSNVGHKDIVTLENEMSKPHSKLIGYNKIFYELNKRYGFKTANEWLRNEWDGHLYMHDAYNATFKPYCFAYDIEKLVNEGLFFIDDFNNQPPQHLTTYTDFVGEFVSWNCNRTSGAVGLPSFLVYSFYFWNKDVKEGFYIKSPEYYRDQSFQEIVYRLNQPFLRGGIQSAFTNFSIFDKPYLEALFGGKTFPDGTFIIDYIDEIKEYQKAFMEVVSEVRSQNMMTFPVLTYSLLRKEGKFVDEDFAKWCCNHNMKWADSNFFVSEDINSLSNCPLSGDTKIIHYSDRYKKHIISKIKNVYTNSIRDNISTIKTISNGKEIECKINKFNIPSEYEITLVNGAKIKTSANHLNLTLRGDEIKTEDLTTNDYLPYYKNPIIYSNNLSYDDGYLVGMFLGDGSFCDKNTVVFSLNRDSKLDLIEYLHNIIPNKFGGSITECDLTSSISGKISCTNVRVKSKYLKGLIKQFVVNDTSLTKYIDGLAYSQSIDFKQGIIDGLYATDGGNSNRIYTSSEKLKDSLVTLFATLGVVTNVSEDNREDRLGTNTCYTVRYYTPLTSRNSLKNVYEIDDDYMWIKIKDIKHFKHNSSSVSYCLEVVDGNEPHFMLANGIVTHNCRLLSDVKELGYFNSIGGTALEVGSIKVNTINLARLSYETKTKEEYLELLKEKVLLCIKSLDVVRHIIKRNVEKGLLPNYTKEIISLESQYNTIGIIGIYETLQKFKLIKKDEFGNTFYIDEGIEFAKEILKTITDTKNKFAEDKDYSINIEEIPAERAAAILMEKDRFFYPNEIYELPLYGNQWIPLGVKTTLQEKIRLSAILDKACSGGSIAHINIDTPFNNFDTAWKMLNHIADEGVMYFAFCTKISACKHNHGFYGETCPTCGNPKETTYSRIVGFLTPHKTYSEERKKEWMLRNWMELDEMSEI